MKTKYIDTDQEQGTKTFGLATQGGPAFAKAFSTSPVAEAAAANIEEAGLLEETQGRSALVQALHRNRARVKIESALDD